MSATNQKQIIVRDILNNFSSANTSFGIEHYPFDNGTANNGFHNKVTTPIYVANPATGLPPVTTTEPIAYGFQDSANVGVIQYSRGPNNAVPSPLTKLQSTSAAIVLAPAGTTNVLDCTGLSRMIAHLYAFDSTVISNVAAPTIFWNGTSFQIGLTSGLVVQASGNIIQLKNNTASPMNVYWTLVMHRLS